MHLLAFFAWTQRQKTWIPYSSRRQPCFRPAHLRCLVGSVTCLLPFASLGLGLCGRLGRGLLLRLPLRLPCIRHVLDVPLSLFNFSDTRAHPFTSRIRARLVKLELGCPTFPRLSQAISSAIAPLFIAYPALRLLLDRLLPSALLLRRPFRGLLLPILPDRPPTLLSCSPAVVFADRLYRISSAAS